MIENGKDDDNRRVRIRDIVPRRAVASLAAGCALLATTPLFGFNIATTHNACAAGLVAFFAGVGLAYDRFRNEPRIAAFFTIFAMWFAVTWVWGLLAIAALGMGAPLQDARLAAIDAALGFDHRAVVAWFARHPDIADVSMKFYHYTGIANLAFAIGLSILGQFERVSRLVGDFALLLAITIVISAVIPGGGSFFYKPYPTEIIANLPSGAGVGHLVRYVDIHSGLIRDLDIFNLSGVVTFPSFHTAMALFIARAVWGVRWLAPVGVVSAALIIVSTIPMGGHYIIDLVATLALYAAICIGPARLRAAAGVLTPEAQRPLAAAR
jgi:hypothetical protein